MDVPPPVGAPVVAAKDWWGENLIVPGLFRDYFAECERQGDVPSFGSALQTPATPRRMPPSRPSCRRVHHPFMPTALIQQLDSFQRASIDRTFLGLVRPLLGDRKERELLVEPEAWRRRWRPPRRRRGRRRRARCWSAASTAWARPRSCGCWPTVSKATGWEVFEAGGADLMAGQQWFGQLEGRIQRTVEELAASKKLIWYIPDILQLARSGTHQGQAASILDQILPAITSGRLIVWTEATPTSTARLVQSRPLLRGAAGGGAAGAADRRRRRRTSRDALRGSAWPRRPTSQIDAGVRAGRAQLGAPVSERRRASRARCSTSSS